MPAAGACGSRDTGRARVPQLRWIAPTLALLWCVAEAALAQQPQLQPQPQSAASSGPALRFGTHSGYERAVVDWAASVGYDVEADGRAVTVTFETAEGFAAAPLRRRLGEAVRDLDVAVADGRVVLRLALPPDVQLRHARSGTAIVLDFVRGAGEPPIDPRSARRLAQERASRPAPPAPLQVVSPRADPTAAPTPTDSTPQPTARTPRPVPAQSPGAIEPPPPRVSSLLPAPLPATPPVARPLPAAAPVAPPELVAGPLPARAAGADGARLDVTPSAIGYRLRLAHRPAPGLAVFLRDRILWVVIDARLDLDISALSPMRRELGPADLQVIGGVAPATVLRLAPPMPLNAAVARQGDTWTIEIGAAAPAPTRQAEPTLRANPDGSNARVIFDLQGAQGLLRLRDPGAHDEVMVVTSGVAGAALAAPRAYPDVRFLPAAQGAVFVPLAERVQARVQGTEIEISGLRPMILPGQPVPAALIATPRQVLLDPPSWNLPAGAVDLEKQALHRAIATAPPQRRGPPRLALARLLFAQGFAPEALAQLRILETDAPDLAALPAQRLLRAAAALLAGQREEAEASIAHPTLAENDEAAMWRALTRSDGLDPQAQGAALRRGAAMAERYPPPMATRIWLDLAAAHLAVAQPEDAARYLDLVTEQVLTEPQRRRLVLMRGEVLARRGDVEAALRLWMPLEAGGPSPTRAEATLARVLAQRARDEVSIPDAIETLDRLRYVWRGDAIELRNLKALAQLHGEIGNHRAGLLLLRDALGRFGETDGGRELTREMDVIFARLFLEGAADALPPIQAIALFEEFRDRVPSGARGDLMVRRMVDRMLEVDLVQRAAGLVAHQLQHRAGAGERAELGAKLALVHLIGGQAGQALTALAETEPDPASALVRLDRRRIGARALANLGRVPEALERLAGDDAPEADLLRAEFLRQTRDWRGLAALLGRRIPTAPETGAPLAQEAARDVLHRAAALALAGDLDGVRGLRQSYGAAMAVSDFANLFGVIAAESGSIPLDLATMLERVNAAAPYQSFLQTYRARLTGGG